MLHRSIDHELLPAATIIDLTPGSGCAMIAAKVELDLLATVG